MSQSLTQRWAFSQPSPLGDVSLSWELTPEGLLFRSDAPLGKESQTLRWDSVVEAATAVVDLPAGKGGPDMVRWMPGQLEWLLVSRSDGSRAFMRQLPGTDVRNAIVAAMRERLGARWIGERLPLQDARKRFAISETGDGIKVALLVGSVIALLLMMLMLLTVASALLLLPAGFALGGWWFRKGMTGLRDALHMAHTPTAKVSSAAMGLVEIEGQAITPQPVPAGVSGTPSVWWDVGVDAWYTDSDGKGGGWRQVMARHGGSAEGFMIEDATGRMPVWLRDADLLLEDHVWEKGRHVLPVRGVALLAGTAFDWHSASRIRVRERRMAADSPVYVLGTLDEARRLPAPGEERGLGRLKRMLRTGEWRKTVVLAMPGLLRAPMAIALSYIEMLTGIGHGGERAQRLEDAPPPPAPAAPGVVLWKGRGDHPFIISDRREHDALAHLRKRSLMCILLGGGMLCWCLYELVKLF